MFILEDFLPYKLSILSQSVSKLIASEYESKFGLSMNQWRCLVIIKTHQPVTAKRISEKTLLNKMVISRALKALTKRLLITASQSNNDARIRLLNLTVSGEEICEKVVPIAQYYEKQILNSLTREQNLAFERIIAQVGKKVEELSLKI